MESARGAHPWARQGGRGVRAAPGGQRSDSFAVGRKHLAEHCRGVVGQIKDYRARFDTALPAGVGAVIDARMVELEKLVADTSSRGLQKEAVWSVVVLLTALEGELSQLLSGVQEAIRARSERAFTHLKRLLAVDGDVAAKWRRAYEEEREEACERLGAVHLLWHGIWSFKAYTLEARTDLVLAEPLRDVARIERSAEGLVLTEWKKAKPDKAATKKFQDGRDQAERYASGPLAANELRGYRYVIVVSEKDVAVPEDYDDGNGVIYRHVNIAVDPDSPSKSRKGAGT